MSRSRNNTRRSVLTKYDFSKQLEVTDFSIFRLVKDYGYYQWNERIHGEQKNASELEEEDILDRIDMDLLPPQMLSVHKLNETLRPFPNLEPDIRCKKFPTSHVTSLAVCKRRGLDLNNVDFVLGGSCLETLANESIPKDTEYSVTKIPGTNIISVRKGGGFNYPQNYADLGFQFKRFIQGKEFEHVHDDKHFKHIQLMEVSGMKCLFDTECDVIDTNKKPVNTKTRNPRWWGTKIAFQMISNGNARLLHGEKDRCTKDLTAVKEYSLESVAAKALYTSQRNENRSVEALESNIVSNLKYLKDELDLFEAGIVFKVTFEDKHMKLHAREDPNNFRLPRDDVIASLLDL